MCTISSAKHTHQLYKKSCNGCVQSTKFEQDTPSQEQDYVCYCQGQPQQGKLGVRKGRMQQGRLHRTSAQWLCMTVFNYPNKMLLIYIHTQTLRPSNKIYFPQARPPHQGKKMNVQEYIALSISIKDKLCFKTPFNYPNRTLI